MMFIIIIFLLFFGDIDSWGSRKPSPRQRNSHVSGFRIPVDQEGCFGTGQRVGVPVQKEREREREKERESRSGRDSRRNKTAARVVHERTHGGTHFN